MKVLRLGQSLCSSSGGGAADSRFIFSVDTTIAGDSGTGKFAVPIVTGQGSNCDIDWGDGNTSTGVTVAETHTYSSAAVYTIKVSGTIKGWQFNASNEADKVNVISNWGDFEFTRSYAFNGCANMTATATDAPKTVFSNMQFTFSSCPNFNGAIGNWDMSPCTSIRGMFFQATIFNQPLNTWDTSNMTEMRDAFHGAKQFNQPLNNWDTSSVSNMSSLFRDAEDFDQDINGWDVRRVSTMANMFKDADDFDKPLNNWVITGVSNFVNFMSTKTPSTYSSANLASLYTGWGALSVVSSVGISFGTAEYDASGASGRSTLETTHSWSITDGGQA
jgi:surface protein